MVFCLLTCLQSNTTLIFKEDETRKQIAKKNISHLNRLEVKIFGDVHINKGEYSAVSHSRAPTAQVNINR